MKITSLKLNVSHLTTNEEALVRAERALEIKDHGDHEGALAAIRPLWMGMGHRPRTQDLYPSVAAEVLLCVGILTGWIGSKEGLADAQEVAKNLISESIAFYESAGDSRKVAAARAEIAYCYWREGGYDEARIMLTEALERLAAGGHTKARALLKLATVEWSAGRSHVALAILMDNSNVFEKVTNHTVRGNYHNELAIVLRNLATSEKRGDYFKRAISEYAEADLHFKLAHNVVFRADVKNNLGFLLFKLLRFKEAHEQLDQARRLTSTVRDKVGIAQIDDTRAQVFIAEKRFKQAEAVARNAVRVLERSGHQCLLAEALTTQGIALARLKRSEPAQFVFQKAIEVAHQVGALNKAGLAALTMLEELDDLSVETLYVAYDRASDWLSKSQSQDILLRVNAAARKVIIRSRSELGGGDEVAAEDPLEALFNKPVDLQREVLKFEGRVIQRALGKANGSLTRAAASLSMSYQALAYILESRQKDLLKERTPIRRRSRRDLASRESAPQS